MKKRSQACGDDRHDSEEPQVMKRCEEGQPCEISRQAGILWLKSEKILLIWAGSDETDKNQTEE